MSDRKCEDRIDEAMESLEFDLEAMIRVSGGDVFDEDDERDIKLLKYIKDDDINDYSVHELAAGISNYSVYRAEISGGGPSSYIEAKVDGDGDLIEVTYHFLDWFDGAKRKVSENSYIWNYMRDYIIGDR